MKSSGGKGMNHRHAPKGRLLGLLGATAMVVLGATSCQHRNSDINTVQPGYVSKAMFTTGDEWYYRRTVVDSETTNEFAIEGTGDIFMNRIKFRVEENFLIAYRPYEALPGSETAEWEGSKDFEGSVIKSWPIMSHFDIIRGYDPSTGNESNVISENSSDRPWHEREYMRVDFAVDTQQSSFTTGWSAYEFPINYIQSGGRSEYRHCDEYATDPFCSRFTNDYFEVVDSVFLGMDLINCAAYVGYSYSGYQNCGFGEAKVRNSFVRIDEPSDYVPRAYPDSIVRKGADGKPLFDDETGEVQREPIYDRFGVFRLSIPTYDRGYGTTESGRLFRAMIFNLWEKHTDDNGNVIPYAARTPKPVIYYLNAEYPDRWRKAAKETADEYNRVLKGMTADLMGKSTNDVPDMFEIRDNDCNEGNIRNFVSTNPDLLFAVERAVCKDGSECNDPLSMIGIGNLKTVCTSLENGTRDGMTGLPGFDWQRIGDARYKMVVWLSNPQQSGWGGYGPMHADPLTGETISATSFLRGFSYERAAATIADYIEYVNDEKTIEEIIYGQDIRKHAAKTLARALEMTGSKANDAFADKLGRRMDKLGSSKAELLPEIDPNWQKNRMKRLTGTRVEQDHIVNDLLLQMASEGTWRPGEPVSDELRYKASLEGWTELQNPYSAVRDRTRSALTNAGFCFLEADFDPHWAGLALQLKDLDREQRYEFVGNMMIKHVLLHELGHNFGLAHNFEGSYDALNYFDEFWDNHWATDLEKVQNRYDERKNTTVMEYMSAKGAFTDRLGRYDEAAIRFAYGNQVQVFDKQDIQGGFPLRFWRYRNDFRSIPDHLCGGTGCASAEEAVSTLRSRQWVEFDPQNPPANEVPYLFCDNYYNRRTPFCATFDYGSNQREIFANYYTMWSDYFFFNNFIRDRLTPLAWSPWNAQMPVFYGMLHWATVGQYLYYFTAIDREFVRSELGQDMVTTVAHGLNFASEVMSTPEPNRMCPWPGTDNPQVFIPWYFLNDCDQYAPINSPYAQSAEAIQLPLGQARPSTLGFTDDFVDYNLEFIGSYFDKFNMMWLLGMTRSNLFLRFDWESIGNDRHERYNYSVFRLFEEEIRNFYNSLINLDPYLISRDTATELGSYWCRDPENPTVASMGHFEPRRMVDPESGDANPGPPQDCESAGVIYPSLLRNMPFSAMVNAHVYFSSPFDTALDMGKSLKVYVVGSDDEFPDWQALPTDEVCSCVDSLTGLDYRAVRQPEGIPDLGCRLVDRACQAQVDYHNDESSDYYRDRWRSWMERLEYARDLARIFDR